MHNVVAMKQADRDEIEQMLAKFAGQIMRHIDKRIDEVREEDKKEHDKIYTAIDNLAHRVTDDDTERAAIIAEQRRHGRWIKELATSTSTRITPAEEL